MAKNDDVSSRFTSLLARRSSGAAEPALVGILNSPFVVTFVGGAILWLVSATWQSMAAEANHERDARQQAYVRQQEVLVDFANHFPYTLYLAREYKRRELWLVKHKSSPDAIYPDRRNWIETRNQYEGLLNKYYEKPSEAYAALITSTFNHDDETIQLAQALVKEMDSLQLAVGDDAEAQIRRQMIELESLYKRLVNSMTEGRS